MKETKPQGIALITEYRRRLAHMERSPRYYGSPTPSGDVADVRENEGAIDRVDQAYKAMLKDPQAVKALQERGFEVRPVREGYEPSLLKNGLFPKSNEIPVFGEEKERG